MKDLVRSVIDDPEVPVETKLDVLKVWDQKWYAAMMSTSMNSKEHAKHKHSFEIIQDGIKELEKVL